MRVNFKKQRYLRFFGPFPLRGRGMSVYPSGRVVRDVSISNRLCFPRPVLENCDSCFYYRICFR